MLHVDIPTRAESKPVPQSRPSPGHLVLPTTPLTQDAQADRIAVKNLTGEALSQLGDHDKREVLAIEELLLDLVDDDVFWEVQANSLAVFVSPESLRTFRLPNRLQRSCGGQRPLPCQAAAPRDHRTPVRLRPGPRPEQCAS